jgi:hypothetical protein
VQVVKNDTSNIKQDKKFYKENVSDYIAAVVVVGVLALVYPLIHIIFLRYKNEKGGGDFSD